MSASPGCPRPGPLLSVVLNGPGGLRRVEFRPPCRRWACPSCGPHRRDQAAEHLVQVSVGGAVFAAKRDPAFAATVRSRARGRGAQSDRAVFTVDGLHLHVAQADVLWEGVTPAKAFPVGDVAELVRAVPISAARWGGGWRPVTGDRDVLVSKAQFVDAEQRAEFERWAGAYLTVGVTDADAVQLAQDAYRDWVVMRTSRALGAFSRAVAAAPPLTSVPATTVAVAG